MQENKTASGGIVIWKRTISHSANAGRIKEMPAAELTQKEVEKALGLTGERPVYDLLMAGGLGTCPNPFLYADSLQPLTEAAKNLVGDRVRLSGDIAGGNGLRAGASDNNRGVP